MSSTIIADRAAVALSLSCVAHCVALPILAISLPFVASAAEAEWVHWLLTMLAIAASGTVIVTAHEARSPTFIVPAFIGICLISCALFAAHFGLDETLLTASGGVLLAVAHIYRLIKHN